MNVGSAEERKRKRLKQCSIEESFKRHRIQDNYDLGRGQYIEVDIFNLVIMSQLFLGGCDCFVTHNLTS